MPDGIAVNAQGYLAVPGGKHLALSFSQEALTDVVITQIKPAKRYIGWKPQNSCWWLSGSGTHG
jgi:hypothetical protein